jgi:hypothetical protein
LLLVAGGKEMKFIESPLIQEILEEQTRQDRQMILLDLYQVKFGPVPADITNRVRSILDLELLRSLICAVVVGNDLDAFRTKLPS